MAGPRGDDGGPAILRGARIDAASGPVRTLVAGTSGIEAALAQAARRRLRVFLVGDACALAAGAVVCIVLNAVWVDSPYFLVLAACVALAALIVALAAVPAARGLEERAATWLCVGNWFAALAGALLTPDIGPVMTLAAQMPVLFAMPYVSRVRLRLLLGITVACLVTVGVLARVQDVTRIDDHIPGVITDLVLIGCVTMMAALVLVIVWQGFSALGDTNAALRRASRELTAQATDLTRSRARLVAATDEARRRIERDLHDGAQQQLTAVAVRLDLARHTLSDHPRADQVLGELSGHLREAIRQVRDLAHGIYPPLLAGGGLAEALPEAAAHAALPCAVEVGRLPRYHHDVEQAVYFCCLEALSNASKHAGPDATITLKARGDHDRIVVTIVDTGVGFRPATTRRGRGLSNMSDRAGIAGGAVAVRSEPGAGTLVTVEIANPAPPDANGVRG